MGDVASNSTLASALAAAQVVGSGSSYVNAQGSSGGTGESTQGSAIAFLLIVLPRAVDSGDGGNVVGVAHRSYASGWISVWSITGSCGGVAHGSVLVGVAHGSFGPGPALAIFLGAAPAGCAVRPRRDRAASVSRNMDMMTTIKQFGTI